ncbi:MAG: response regulator transcription factor [Planctomycetota bacterium]|nr:response regulator transcription factor [Planctomycetota bacterium]
MDMRENNRVLIVDGHPVMRAGLAAVIRGTDCLEVCGEAGDAFEAVGLVETLQPDLVVVDLCLPDRPGIEFVKDICERNPLLRVLVVSQQANDTFAEHAIRAGAHGYVCKNEPLEALREAFSRVLRGQVYVSERVSTRLLARSVGRRKATMNTVDDLSDRELQVFDMIGHGLSHTHTGNCM